MTVVDKYQRIKKKSSWQHFEINVIETELLDLFCFGPPSLVGLLQSTCNYIVNQYRKICHVRLWGANNLHPLSWGCINGKYPKILRKAKYSKQLRNSIIFGIFSVCAPSRLVGALYLHPQTHVQFCYIMIYSVMTRALLLGGA